MAPEVLNFLSGEVLSQCEYGHHPIIIPNPPPTKDSSLPPVPTLDFQLPSQNVFYIEACYDTPIFLYIDVFIFTTTEKQLDHVVIPFYIT